MKVFPGTDETSDHQEDDGGNSRSLQNQLGSDPDETLRCNRAPEVIWPGHYLLRCFSAASGRLRHLLRRKRPRASPLPPFFFFLNIVCFPFRPDLLNITLSHVRCARKNHGSILLVIFEDRPPPSRYIRHPRCHLLDCKYIFSQDCVLLPCHR